MNWQAIIFDFDGVILDSVNVKTETFAEIFRPHGSEVEAEVVSYHLANTGVTRFDKFRHYYTNILNKPITEEMLSELSKQFSDLAVRKVIASPYIEGALETLEELNLLRIPAYVVSGTPDEELRQIVKTKGLSHYFEEVHGSPRPKEEIVRDILERNNYSPSHCLLVGDSMTDYLAAQETGTRFLGIVKNSQLSPFPDGAVLSQIVSIKYPSKTKQGQSGS